MSFTYSVLNSHPNPTPPLPVVVAKVREAHLEKKWGVKKGGGGRGSKQIYCSARTSSCQGLSRAEREGGASAWEWWRGGGGAGAEEEEVT